MLQQLPIPFSSCKKRLSILRKMNASNRKGLLLKIEIDHTSCLYFRSHFDKVFMERIRIKDGFILKHYSLREAFCYCARCRNKIQKYFCNYNTLSDEFFFEGIKLLIRYHSKVYCDGNLVIYMNARD